ncbi:hypothetical protein F5B22DRAFT_494052 [Xylaria bambusicola]|uniref:uncharacterized protein n=1 Tax=Xylaria bambusicola TaxID=326684 RepID=UPI0020083BA0|nr:uncharacterized protein F5B22DRAFT_494052 [Xylaria bambusicola]KAI0505836.1 hypothetical protein F5B22DRAFT_494052 [Xylaria bambusicola]
MACNSGPAPRIASSTPASSLSNIDILGDTKIRRSFVKIPSNQKILLSGYESWASHLSRRANGFLNVPPEMLDQVKASHVRQNKTSSLDLSADTMSQPEHDSDVPEPSGSQSSPQPHAQGGDKDDDDDDDDDDDAAGETLSWPPSPEHHVRLPRAESEKPDQPFLTQLPEKSPPQPTAMTLSPEHPKLPDFPPSSQGPEDELEVEVPAALNYSLLPINKPSLPMLATPPSAQVVPCTLEQSSERSSMSASKSENPKLDPAIKRHRYNRVPELYRGPKTDTVSSHLKINATPNKAAATSGRSTDIESSLPTNIISPFVIPSTKNDLTPEREEHTLGPGLASSYQLAGSSSNNFHSILASGSEPSMQMHPAPVNVIGSSQGVTPAAHSVAPPAITSKSWEAPFVHYTATYPRYNGTIHHFIMACILIQQQQRRRRIRTSLYDDFIRAWVDGYLPYVDDCDETKPPRKALTAIEWYNDIDDDPLFTERVVTRDNLQLILDCYPHEVKLVRQEIENSNSQGSNESQTSNGQSKPHPRDNVQPDASPSQRSKGKEPIRQPVEAPKMDARVSSLSPTALRQLPHMAANQQIPVHKSFGGIEARPAQRESLTRSLSESTMHRKRTATNELRSEGTKRVSLGLLPDAQSRMWSDSGSTTSNHSNRSKNTARTSVTPEPAAGRVKARVAEDPEGRRARRLAKHIKKRLSGRESIASPAPIRNTPTSGQKY